MNKINYSGPFKDHLRNHVQLKQAIGYKYVTETLHLKRFDNFTQKKYPHATNLTKEMILDWCSKKPHETQQNQSARGSTIRQFSKYLEAIGFNAYILPKGHYQQGPQYVPHIYSPKELSHFFAQTDHCHYCSERPMRHLIMPLFFRMIYQCGVRVSEARLLKVGDVDLVNGILDIQHSKKDNSRLVPMSDKLVKRAKEYSAIVHAFASSEDYFFPAPNQKPMTLTNVYHNFRRFLWQAKIAHGGRGQGPRIHDFRHSYAVHRLKKWSEQGKDLNVLLPLLKTYMGHESFQDTAYYLRLTADVFPDITLKLEGMFAEIIPELAGEL